MLVAEGQKESQILAAEGDKRAAILHAEAVKEAKIREAEGEAEAILKIQEAEAKAIELINASNPGDGYIKIKSLEAFSKAADGQINKDHYSVGNSGTCRLRRGRCGIGQEIKINKKYRLLLIQLTDTACFVFNRSYLIKIEKIICAEI